MIGRCGTATATGDMSKVGETSIVYERTNFRPEGIVFALLVFLKDNLKDLIICESPGLDLVISYYV
jgi:hypothetical protein